MKSFTTIAAIAGLVSSVAAHGYVKSPPARKPGQAQAAACGDQVFNQQNSDIYGNVQGALQVAQSDLSACKIWQCKGMMLEDQDEANTQTYTAGQVVSLEVEIRAPHEGTANVSIVKTSSDTIIGSVLKSWDVYASNSRPITSDQTNFDITLPDVSAECANRGDCVIQWWWDAASIDQTYEACIDFTMGGGSGGSSPAPAPSASAPASAPASSAPAATAAPSATPAPTPVENEAPASTSAAAAPTATSGSGSSPAPGSGSDSDLPEEFTVAQFVSWLRNQAAGAAAPAASAASAQSFGNGYGTYRRHARAFRK